MDKKIVLITGAGGGIGRATVDLFASKGWHVIGVDRNPYGEGFPTDGAFIQADVSHPESLERLFAQVKGNTQTLHALVNNAAVQVAKPLVETTIEEWDEVLASNLRSAFIFAKLAYPLFKAASEGAMDHRLGLLLGDLDVNHLGERRTVDRDDHRTIARVIEDLWLGGHALQIRIDG